MSSISQLLDVYKMNELSVEVRCSLIIKLSQLINDEFGSNLTEPVVYELVKMLNPEHEIFKNPNFVKLAGKWGK